MPAITTTHDPFLAGILASLGMGQDQELTPEDEARAAALLRMSPFATGGNTTPGLTGDLNLERFSAPVLERMAQRSGNIGQARGSASLSEQNARLGQRYGGLPAFMLGGDPAALAQEGGQSLAADTGRQVQALGQGAQAVGNWFTGALPPPQAEPPPPRPTEEPAREEIAPTAPPARQVKSSRAGDYTVSSRRPNAQEIAEARAMQESEAHMTPGGGVNVTSLAAARRNLGGIAQSRVTNGGRPTGPKVSGNAYDPADPLHVGYPEPSPTQRAIEGMVGAGTGLNTQGLTSSPIGMAAALSALGVDLSGSDTAMSDQQIRMIVENAYTAVDERHREAGTVPTVEDFQTELTARVREIGALRDYLGVTAGEDPAVDALIEEALAAGGG